MMKIHYELLVLSILMLFAASVSVASQEVVLPGADAIEITSYYEQKVEVDGIGDDYSVRIAGGSLPYGLRLTDAGVIEGYPTAVQESRADFVAVDDAGNEVKGSVTFRVVGNGVRLLYRELPIAEKGQKAEMRIEGTGGTAPYRCTLRKVRTFRNGGAAKPGAKAPAVDEAPGWLTLSNDCTLTAEPDEDTIVLMLIGAADADGAEAEEFYALRSAADPGSAGWLEAKAREYNRDYQARFSPYGLTLEIDPNGAYHSYGDAAMWTGTYLAGAAYYYAVTGEDFARANLEKALNATTKLREITGVPGLIARAYEFDEWKGRRDAPYIKVNPAENSYLVEEGKYKGWRFISTASRDQFTGVLWGNDTVVDLFDDPALVDPAVENIVSMAAHIWDNKMHIMDKDGKPTRHGVMSGYGIQDSEGHVNYDPYTSPARMPNGFNGALVLNWFNMAATAARDAKTRKLWRERYKNLVSNKPNPAPGRSFERSYTSHLKKLYVYGEAYNSYWDTVWFNLNLLFNNYFHLIRNEKRPKLRERYRAVLRNLWEDKKEMKNGCEAPEERRAGREKNPHFTWQYLAAQGDREPDKIFEALSELIVFPQGPRAPFVVSEPVEFETVPGHEDWACEPVPVQYRKPSDFQWQRSPYRVNATWPSSGNGRNFAGVDVITPYWMGRYFGYIPSYL